MNDDDRLREAVGRLMSELCGNLTIYDLTRAVDAMTNRIAEMSPSEPVLGRLYMAIHNELYAVIGE